MKWVERKRLTTTGALKKELGDVLGLPGYIITAMANRGITTDEKAREIFAIDEAPLNPPSLFEEMEKSVERIQKAVELKEKITIYGDYDVDGVTSIAVLYRFLTEKMKHSDVDYYIPHRQDEGYGLNEDAIRQIADNGTKLIITVDCGIGSKNEVETAAEAGIDVIVTDHHIPEAGSMPGKAYSVLNPKVSKKYPDKDLSGVGVAYKLACGIADKMKIKLGDEYLDFVSLGTVADIVPLSYENRIIVRRGFRQIEKTTNPGLKELKEVAGLKKGSPITTYHVGFVLGPRINAAGRLEHAKMAAELFISPDRGKVREIAAVLDSTNSERKKMMNKAQDEAAGMLKDIFDPEKDFVIVLYNAEWNAGIVGLVASKITGIFSRPSFILTKSDDGLVHGSARSAGGVDIYSLIKRASEHLVKFGGHRLAAGVTLKEENIEAFRKTMNDYLLENMKPGDFEPVLEIDCAVSESINIKDIKIFDKLQPWGEGNPRPVFTLANVEVKNAKMYKNNTMKFYGKFGEKIYNFLLFGCDSEKEEMLKPGQYLDVAFTPKIDTWQGEENLTLEVRDIK